MRNDTQPPVHLYRTFQITEQIAEDVEDFEAFIGPSMERTVATTATMDTVLGTATWASGTYFEDDEVLEMFGSSPHTHPAPGSLIFSALSVERIDSSRSGSR